MRLYLLDKLFRICLLILVVVLWYHQIIKVQYFSHLSNKNRIRILPSIPERGDILDARGRKIATNFMSYDVIAIPQELNNNKSALINLEKILNIPADKLQKTYHTNYTAPFAPVTLVKNIPLEKMFKIEELRPNLGGIEVQANYRRIYPFEEAGAHLIGYLSEINMRELDKLKPYGYGIKNTVGKSGIEKNFDLYLRGTPGGKQIEVDNRGNSVRILGEKKSVPGKDIGLTIDAEWQEKARQLLSGRRGVILVMDIKDGKMLVTESSPSFNPNLFVSGNSREMRSLLNSTNSPLLNRAVSANFSPGSIFKLVTAIAGLESKKINEYSKYTCEGKLFIGNKEFDCWEENGHGNQSIVEAITHSCNIFFYKLGLKVGPEKICDYARILGLGEYSGIGFEGEAAGLIPNPAWKNSTYKEKWFDGDTLNMSIGQGFILASPIQILRLVSCIGNGGFLVKPYILQNIAGMPVKENRREYSGIGSETLNLLREGMFHVVNSVGGTGNRARVEGLDIAAKTATVQTTKGNTHAWISGFLPYENPKLSFVIFLEYGGHGGVETANICQQFFTSLKEEVLNYR